LQTTMSVHHRHREWLREQGHSRETSSRLPV
jgi:hypothetical protein